MVHLWFVCVSVCACTTCLFLVFFVSLFLFEKQLGLQFDVCASSTVFSSAFDILYEEA